MSNTEIVQKIKKVKNIDANNRNYNESQTQREKEEKNRSKITIVKEKTC